MKSIYFSLLILAVAGSAHSQQAEQSAAGRSGSGISTGNVPAQVGKPTILYKERAKYTEKARALGIHGYIVLSALFAADGNIVEIKVVRGLPEGLNEMAIEAAKKIRFKPAVNKDGQPISVWQEMEFDFHLYELDERTARITLHYDFPLLSNEVINLLAIAIANRHPNSNQGWLMAQWCIEQGIEMLPRSEQEEYQSLKIEIAKNLEASAKEAYQSLATKSEQRPLNISEKMEMAGLLFKGVSKLPGAKRKRLQEIYRQAAKLGINQLDKFK